MYSYTWSHIDHKMPHNRYRHAEGRDCKWDQNPPLVMQKGRPLLGLPSLGLPSLGQQWVMRLGEKTVHL
jgi:hypothetical protein